MRPLTDTIPKAMAPLRGDTLIASGIEQLRKHVEYIHVTVGHKRAMLAGHVIDRGVASVFNTEGKGNAWWVYNTLMRQLDEPIVVLTCDNVVDIDLQLYLDDYLFHGSPACMVVPVAPVKDLEGDYVIVDGRNRVLAITRETQSNLFCSGIQILSPAKA